MNTVLYPGRGDIYGVIAKKGLYNVALRHTNCVGILSHLAQHNWKERDVDRNGTEFKLNTFDLRKGVLLSIVTNGFLFKS